MTDSASVASSTSVATNINTRESGYTHLIYMLNFCSIICTELDGLLIPRELLLNDDKYKELVKSELPILKTIFSSSYLTSLQSSATSKQKFPLLNLIRQMVRCCNFKLTPKRISDGYAISGEKKYKRMFIVEKMRTTF